MTAALAPVVMIIFAATEGCYARCTNLGDLIFLSKLLPLCSGAGEEGSSLACHSPCSSCDDW